MEYSLSTYLLFRLKPNNYHPSHAITLDFHLSIMILWWFPTRTFCFETLHMEKKLKYPFLFTGFIFMGNRIPVIFYRMDQLVFWLSPFSSPSPCSSRLVLPTLFGLPHSYFHTFRTMTNNQSLQNRPTSLLTFFFLIFWLLFFKTRSPYFTSITLLVFYTFRNIPNNRRWLSLVVFFFFFSRIRWFICLITRWL